MIGKEELAEIVIHLEKEIHACIILKEDMSMCSFQDETGVVITGNEAKKIVEVLKATQWLVKEVK